MSKTKTLLESELKTLQETWIPPHRFEELITDLHNRDEQLSVVKTARQHLEAENEELHRTVKALRAQARQDQEALMRLETVLEQLIPPEYLGEHWDHLGEPARLFIEHLLANQRGGLAPSTVRVPLVLEIEVKVKYRDDRRRRQRATVPHL